MGLAVWCADQAGPYQTIPHAGHSWRPEGDPARQPHEYLRDGTAKALTLFHPADGHARVRGVTACPNSVLHPWLEGELASILAAMPDPPGEPAAGWPAAWGRRQDGLSIKPTLPSQPPPLRMLLVLDNLAGHKTPEFVCWGGRRAARRRLGGVLPRPNPETGRFMATRKSSDPLAVQGYGRPVEPLSG